jgi:dihydrofolate reductase
MKIIIIVARSTEGVIGKNNALPWRLPADLKHFKQHTMGFPVIMGRKTWESLGRALPERRNIVISRQTDLHYDSAETFTSLEKALDACKDSAKVFIIGGANVYEQALEIADEMLITEVEIDVTGDAFFPEFNEEDWGIVDLEEFPAEPDPKNPQQSFPAHTFVTYARK